MCWFFLLWLSSNCEGAPLSWLNKSSYKHMPSIILSSQNFCFFLVHCSGLQPRYLASIHQCCPQNDPHSELWQSILLKKHISYSLKIRKLTFLVPNWSHAFCVVYLYDAAKKSSFDSVRNVLVNIDIFAFLAQWFTIFCYKRRNKINT